MEEKDIKKDFPVLNNTSPQPLIYLDNAATTHKPQAMVDALSTFYAHEYATVHRSLYPLGEQATLRYEQVRKKTAEFINAQHQEEIIFTKGTTEGINAVAQAWARKQLKAGDEILLSHVEHHANLLPWQQVSEQTGAVIKFIPLNQTSLMLDYTDELITSKTKLVAVTLSSNVLGLVWQEDQLLQVITRAHSVGARVLLDAAQAIAHEIVDVANLNPDFLVFSTHKVYGPTGLGILYIKKELHGQVEPYQRGGSMVYNVAYQTASWAPAPQKFEAGTPPIAEVIAWGATIDYLTSHDYKKIFAHETELCAMLVTALDKIPEVTIIGNSHNLKTVGHLVSCKVASIHAHDIASYLGAKNIAVRAGHHCAQPLIDLLGGEALLRISIGMYTNVQDIEACITELKNAITYLTV